MKSGDLVCVRGFKQHAELRIYSWDVIDGPDQQYQVRTDEPLIYLYTQDISGWCFLDFVLYQGVVCSRGRFGPGDEFSAGPDAWLRVVSDGPG